MKATLLVLAVCAAALVGATHASARQSTCAPGGITSRTFCGPARAKLTFGGHTYKFNRGGNCTTDSSTWSLNLGTFTLKGKPIDQYLGVTVFSKKPGTHDAAVSWQVRGGNYTLANAKATLKRGLKKGTFVGSMGHGRKASGSFTCK